jgi:hypothetical protein
LFFLLAVFYPGLFWFRMGFPMGGTDGWTTSPEQQQARHHGKIVNVYIMPASIESNNPTKCDG